MKEFVCPTCKKTMVLNENDGILSCTQGHTLLVAEYKSPELGSTSNTYYNRDYAVCNINEEAESDEENDIEEADLGDVKISYIPFQIDEKEAEKKIKKGIFTGKSSDSLDRFYVPVWISTIDTGAGVEGIACSYTADNEISYYDVDTKGKLGDCQVMTAACNDISAQTLSLLAPFTISDSQDIADASIRKLEANVPFSPDYARKKCEKIARDKASFRLNSFESSHNVKYTVKSSVKESSLLYLPVYNRNGIYINGQSGKVMGKAPVSKIKLAAFSLCSCLILYTIITLILQFSGVIL